MLVKNQKLFSLIILLHNTIHFFFVTYNVYILQLQAKILLKNSLVIIINYRATKFHVWQTSYKKEFLNHILSQLKVCDNATYYAQK